MEFSYYFNQIAFLFKAKHTVFTVVRVSVLYSNQSCTSESSVGLEKNRCF